MSCLCWWEAFLHGGTMYELCVTSWHSELVVPTQMRGGYLCDVLQPSVCTVLLCPHVRPLCVPLCASVTFCHCHHVRDETGSRGHRNISVFCFHFQNFCINVVFFLTLSLTFKTFVGTRTVDNFSDYVLWQTQYVDIIQNQSWLSI